MTKGRKTGGRKKGTPNKITSQVREMVEAALRAQGDADYFVMLAKEKPKAFIQLISKML